MSVESSQSGQVEKQVKHAVADTLANTKAAVAVVTKKIQGNYVKTFYVGVDDGFVEVLQDRPRGNHIKRFTLCKRVEQAEEAGHHIEIKAELQLESCAQKDIAKKVKPFLNNDESSKESVSKPKPKSDEEKYGKGVVDDDPYEHFDNPSKAAGHSGVHGGGWD